MDSPVTTLRSTLLLARMHLVELLSSKRLLFAVLLAILPPALAWVAAEWGPQRRHLGPGMIHARASVFLLLQVIVPLGSLLVASGVIADEVEGRTITYLFTRSTPRAAVFLGRVLAVVAIVVPLYALSAWGTALGGAQRPGTTYPDAVRGVLYAAAAGAALYALIGAVLGVLFRRALVVSLVYAFAVEGMIANLTGNTSRLSIQYWLRSLAVDMQVEPWSRIRTLTQLPAELATHGEAATRLVTIAVILVIVGALLVRRKQYVLTS